MEKTEINEVVRLMFKNYEEKQKNEAQNFIVDSNREIQTNLFIKIDKILSSNKKTTI
ncbi:hypothetical protein [Spirochaeta lutea]|uniref:hypothetical protein n=1 Tax=Spirochaeta lutea TaxID=1480694 RepID=UPI000B204E70|nr:hypothetical protein [Spirochaeta lutea]